MGPKKKGKQPAKRSRSSDDEESPGSGARRRLADDAPSSQLETLPDPVLQRILTFVGLRESWKCARGISKRIRAMLIANEWERLSFPCENPSLRARAEQGLAQAAAQLAEDIAGWTKRANRGHVRVQSLFVEALDLHPKRELVPALVAALPGLKHVVIRHGDISAGIRREPFDFFPSPSSLKTRHEYAAALLRAAVASSAATLAALEFALEVDALNVEDAIRATPAPTGRLQRGFLTQLGKLPALRRLNLVGYCSMAPEFVRGLAGAAPGLTSFHFASVGPEREFPSGSAFDDSADEEGEGQGEAAGEAAAGAAALGAIVEAVAEGLPNLEELDVGWTGSSVGPGPLETVGRLRSLRHLLVRCSELARGALPGLVRGLGPQPALAHLEIRELHGSISFEGQLEALRRVSSLRRLEIEPIDVEPAAWAALGTLSQLEHLWIRARVAGVTEGWRWTFPAAFPRLRTLTLVVDGCAGPDQSVFFDALAGQLAEPCPWGLRDLTIDVVPTPCRCDSCDDGTGQAALSAALGRLLALDAIRRALVSYDRLSLDPRRGGAVPELEALAGCTRLARLHLETHVDAPLKAAEADAFAPLGGLPAEGRKFSVMASAGAASKVAATRLRALLPGWLVQIPERQKRSEMRMTPAAAFFGMIQVSQG